MRLDDDELKSLITQDQHPKLSKDFITSTLGKLGLSGEVSRGQYSVDHEGNKLSWKAYLLLPQTMGLLCILILFVILYAQSIRTIEEDELHHIDTISLSSLLVL